MGIRSFFRKLFINKRKKPARASFKPILLKGGVIDVKLEELTGFSDAQEHHFRMALPLIRDIANSEEFKYAVTHPSRHLEFTNGMSTHQLYELFTSGMTRAGNKKDRTMNIDYNGYYTRKNTIGYVITGNRDDEINFNKKYFSFSDNGTVRIVSNFFHEDRHNAGLWHEKNGYTQWNVPYFYGNVAEMLASKVLDGRIDLTPIVREKEFDISDVDERSKRMNDYTDKLVREAIREENKKAALSDKAFTREF